MTKTSKQYGVFVTGTDTGVGKTQISAALAARLSEQQISVRPRKPVESGCPIDDNKQFLPQDALTLKQAAQCSDPLDIICPYPLRPAISPQRAAQQAGIKITLSELKTVCLNDIKPDDFLLVEAAGGFFSPLAHQSRCSDLAQQLKLPVLLVVANRLGCINHTLLTAQAIKHAGLELSAVVLNTVEQSTNTDMNNADDLKQWLDCPLFCIDSYPDSQTPWKSIVRQSEAISALAEHFSGSSH
ncbi:MAG: dethiobiotin synthase [Gammaproteobacteria bacterium]|nr:dethiobiotin synthase [Gammaproteobacteria bacterium]